MTQPPNGQVTIREVYGLIEKIRAELLLEMEKIRAELILGMEKIHTDLEKRILDHDHIHNEEDARRASRLRWAVTSVIAGIGVVVAIYAAFRGL